MPREWYKQHPFKRGTNVICRLTQEIRRSSGALHTGRDPANQSLEQSSDRRKSRFEVISVLSGFSFLPSHMSPDQLHLQVSFEVSLQTNEHLLIFLGSIISLWRLEKQREKQATVWTGGKTKQRDRHGYKLWYFSHALVVCLSHVKTGKPHKWHLHLCKGLQRCGITLCCPTQKGLQQNLGQLCPRRITEYFNKMSYLTNKALFFLLPSN